MGEQLPHHLKTLIERLHRNMNDLFARWSARFHGDSDGNGFSLARFSGSADTSIEIDEINEALIATAALPGLERKEIKVEVTENRLVVRGDKTRSAEKKRRGYYQSVSAHGSFAHAISLPCAVDPGKTRAKLKNGILTVTLPKSEKAEKNRIKITIAA